MRTFTLTGDTIWFGVIYTVLADPDMIATDRYAAIGLPATFHWTARGRRCHVALGEVMPAEPAFADAIDRILQ